MRGQGFRNKGHYAGWAGYKLTNPTAPRSEFGFQRVFPTMRESHYFQRWKRRAARGGETIMADLGLKTRVENIAAGGTDEWERALFERRREITRDEYGALRVEQIDYTTAQNIVEREWLISQPNPLALARKCVAAIENQGVDEHGGWKQYADFDKHRRGSCINVDIYGIDAENDLYICQVRQFTRQYKNGFGNTKKSYFLIGYNENGNPFAHPVSGHKIHAAIKKDPSPESPVRAARAWIWGIKEDQLDRVLRNGDTALIPAKRPPKTAEEITPDNGMMKIIDSHYIYSRDIRLNGDIYAHNPTLRHFKNQHPTQKGKGWYKIVIGNRAQNHDFARPTID